MSHWARPGCIFLMQSPYELNEKERLAQVRKQISREEHENRHMGNYRRIYPPEDKALLEKYENLLAVAFQTFLSGRAASFQRELNNPLKRMKEEDILDLLEQCEIDDEKLMGKTTKARGPKVQYISTFLSYQSLTLSPRLKSSGVFIPHCSLTLLGSEVVFRCAAKVGLELLVSGDSLASAYQSAKIIGMSHCIQCCSSDI
ncbi:Tubulin polyglutamylase TTLL7, partial [Plecturocebus cupreus]